jgi:hypothetical protein
MENTKIAAKIAYDTYCHAVGGKAFNGDPLPSWEDFSADPKKQPQANGWLAAAEAVLNRFGIAS